MLNVSLANVKKFHHCLIAMIEKWRESVDKGGAFGALLTDQSKTFDYLPYELHAFGFDKSLNLTYGYLSNRKCKSRWGI